MDFNKSISLAMAKTMQQMSDFVFISMANFTLVRRDSCQEHLRSGIKKDTLNALRTTPLNMATLFHDNVLKKADEEIAQFENKGLKARHISGQLNVVPDKLSSLGQTIQSGLSFQIYFS